MSYDVGCCGVWGVEINTETVGAVIYPRILKEIDDHRYEDDFEENRHDYMDELLSIFNADVLAELKDRCGIIATPDARLQWSGNGDETPGQCATSPSTLLFGIGMFLKPWEWPPVDESWKKVAELHTWVWGG